RLLPHPYSSLKPRLEYSAKDNLLRISVMPLLVHGCGSLWLSKCINLWREMDLISDDDYEAIILETDTSIVFKDGSSKIPDAALKIYDESPEEESTGLEYMLDDESLSSQSLASASEILEQYPDTYPTVVLEVANSQDYDEAKDKIKSWFQDSRGIVKVGILINLTPFRWGIDVKDAPKVALNIGVARSMKMFT